VGSVLFKRVSTGDGERSHGVAALRQATTIPRIWGRSHGVAALWQATTIPKILDD
jgi:hypothetical protein